MWIVSSFSLKCNKRSEWSEIVSQTYHISRDFSLGLKISLYFTNNMTVLIWMVNELSKTLFV